MTNEERELWTEYRRTRDVSIRNRLVERHIPLAVSIARKHPALNVRQVELDDLLSDAYMALIRAVEAYDPDRGCAFSTYATRAIRGGIQRGLAHRSCVGKYASQRAGRDVAIVRFTDMDRDDGDSQFQVKDGSCSQPIDNVIDAELWAQVDASCYAGDARIVRMMYRDGMLQSEVGRRIGVTRERVRQLHNRAIERLRSAMQ